MTNEKKFTLLQPSDPEPVEIFNPEGTSRFVLTCEHGGRAVPAKLAGLGVEPNEMDRHIAWDIGAAGTARRLAERLDAVLVMQRYSRLVVDCNRPLEALDLMPEVSDGTSIPVNVDLTAQDRAARLSEIFTPYHAAIRDLLDERSTGQSRPILFSVHSFTPALRVDPTPRPMELGLLFGKDDRLARAFQQALSKMDNPYMVACNEPYRIGMGADYTIPVHGEGRGLSNLLIEIRNDGINTLEKAQAMGDFLAQALLCVEADSGAVLTAS